MEYFTFSEEQLKTTCEHYAQDAISSAAKQIWNFAQNLLGQNYERFAPALTAYEECFDALDHIFTYKVNEEYGIVESLTYALKADNGRGFCQGSVQVTFA